MKASDAAMTALRDSLAAEIGADAAADFMVELGCLVRRYRREAEQRAVDSEAARLLHIGAHILALRTGKHRSTIYRRAERGRKFVALNPPDATEPA